MPSRWLLACFLVGATTGPRPAAADFPSALVLGVGYAVGPPAWAPWENLPELEDSLCIFGSVARVGAPFDDLVPAGPHELTYVFESYACVFARHGTDFECSNSEIAVFAGGSIRVYLDSTPDADFADPATFRDGELVLDARSDPMLLLMEDHCVTGREYMQRAFVEFVGGAWLPRVSKDGVGFAGANIGEFRGDIPADVRALGYVGQSQGRIDVETPTAVEATTWGRVKALYR
jgi:hypothetical protein